MKKHFKYSSPRQLWRILITDDDKLILETRDTVTKEVYFHCFQLADASCLFSDFQMEEKSWIGIESVYKDIIYFHHFPKRDLPTHKGIIAFDITEKKEIWRNPDLSFHFVWKDKVYCYRQGFDERNFVSIDYKTGIQLEDLGSNYSLVNGIRNDMDNFKDWSAYLYPEKMSSCTDLTVKELIDTHIKNKEIAGEIEYNKYKSLLVFNYHQKNSGITFTNYFCAVDRTSGLVVIEEILNDQVSALFTDSFFVYKNFLFLLKEKNELIIYQID